jgi:hypothetical protein
MPIQRIRAYRDFAGIDCLPHAIPTIEDIRDDRATPVGTGGIAVFDDAGGDRCIAIEAHG